MNSNHILLPTKVTGSKARMRITADLSIFSCSERQVISFSKILRLNVNTRVFFSENGVNTVIRVRAHISVCSICTDVRITTSFSN
jgi:hypothetical protein